MPQNSAGVDWHAQVGNAQRAGKLLTLSLPVTDWDILNGYHEVKGFLWRIVEGCEPWFLIDRLPYVEGSKMKVQLLLKEGVE